MLKKCGVYKITNKINGKFYIGSSINITDRELRHKSDLSCGTHHSEHLQRAYDKYGKENFKFEILELCNEEDVVKREQYYLDKLKPYDYNVGYNISKKASFPYVGRGERHWNYGKYGEQNAKSVKVVQLDMDNKYIRTFDSANMAARELNTDASTIIKICKGKLNSIHGYKWAYLEDYKNGNYKNNTYKFKRGVVQLSLDGQYIKKHESINQAGRTTKINYKNIHSCCNNKKKTAGGFKWMYYDDYIKQESKQMALVI